MTTRFSLSPWGTATGATALTNDELGERFDLPTQWILDRTGMSTRMVGATTASVAAAAGRAALSQWQGDPSDIDLLLLATTTPDRLIPSTSSRVANDLGLVCGALDVNAACAGFVYGLILAHAMLAGAARHVLLIGADAMSAATDPSDRNTAILFGDGAGATVVSPSMNGCEVLGIDLGSDGSLERILFAEHGGTMVMDGREVFRHAVRSAVASAQRALERAGLSAEEITLFVPHQANVRIIEAIIERLGLDRARVAIALDGYGNTSSASIPLALAARGCIDEGSIVLLTGFGAGMAWASAVIRWQVASTA